MEVNVAVTELFKFPVGMQYMYSTVSTAYNVSELY